MTFATRKPWSRRWTGSRSATHRWPRGGRGGFSARSVFAGASSFTFAGASHRARQLLNALLTLPVRGDRDVALGKFARRVVKLARDGVEARRDTAPDDVVGLVHDLRIAYKKLRYAVEIFSEALPADLAAMGEPAARVPGSAS